MYVCLCNPFTDHDVRDYLESCGGRATVSAVYKACSGGESPGCCTCLPALRDMIRGHNRMFTIRELTDGLTVVKKELV